MLASTSISLEELLRCMPVFTKKDVKTSSARRLKRGQNFAGSVRCEGKKETACFGVLAGDRQRAPGLCEIGRLVESTSSKVSKYPDASWRKWRREGILRIHGQADWRRAREVARNV